MKRTARFILLLASASACVVSPAKVEVMDHREVAIDAQELTRITFDVEAGDLELIGQPGSSEVRLEAELGARGFSDQDAREILGKLEFSHEVRDGVLEVTHRISEVGWNRSAWIDLTAYLPESIPVEIRDTSGDVFIRALKGGGLVEDSSGDIEATSLALEWTVRDSSGDIELTDLSGAVSVLDSSGDITIRGNNGAIQIEDSSGDISVVNIAGNVQIADTAGNISVMDIEGDLEIVSDTSGDVDYANVRGEVRLPEEAK